MAVDVLSPQDLVRQAVIQVASLPEPDLRHVLAYIELLKEQQTASTRESAVAAIRAEADRLAAGMEGQSRTAVMAEFRAALESIRTQAIAQDTAIDGDWQRD